MAETMKWFCLAFLLLLGFTEGQNGGIDPQCNIIAEEVLQLKQPLIAQLKAFAADNKFQENWSSFFHDDCFYDPYACENDYTHEKDSYGKAFREGVKPFQVKGEILNATLNVAGIISSHNLKLQQLEKRKFEIIQRYYYGQHSFRYTPFDIFVSDNVNDYDSLASASRCQPCTDTNKFSLCLYKELNEINEGLAIFQEVAVSSRSTLLPDTIYLLIKEFNKFPNITNERILDFYKNTVLRREYNKYLSDVKWQYGFYLENAIRNSVQKFTQLVQTILEPGCTQNACVGKVLKNVITQIRPYLTPTANALLPTWNFDVIVSSYVKPTTQTDINLIRRFEEGFSRYVDSVFPRNVYQDYMDVEHYTLLNALNNPYSIYIYSITNKGFEDLKQCPDFGWVYEGNSNFKYFVDNSHAIYEDYMRGFLFN